VAYSQPWRCTHDAPPKFDAHSTDCGALYSRRQTSSEPVLREPQILHEILMFLSHILVVRRT
jgi:hypothetical protein